MFRKSLVRVWAGIILLACMFLMGQDQPCWPECCQEWDLTGWWESSGSCGSATNFITQSYCGIEVDAEHGGICSGTIDQSNLHLDCSYNEEDFLCDLSIGSNSYMSGTCTLDGGCEATLERGVAFLEQLLQNTLEAYDLMRNSIGAYADHLKFVGNQEDVPCSIASVGMALVALCVADATGYDSEAEGKALQTLRAFSGQVSGFNPARNPVNGFFRHWIDMETGARAWDSEYSSIDSGELVAGALFCKSYFKDNAEIAQLADSLYLSVDWSAAIANSETGGIWMVFDDEGNGSHPTTPFNEYMITAWLAKNDPRANSEATALWNNHYADPSALPKKDYEGYELLTDSDQYLSSFVIQFSYYLCHPFAASEAYISYLTNAMNADLKWWSESTEEPEYVWGTGAGPTVSVGYNADRFDYNPDQISSPQIIAGFIPIRSKSLEDLRQLWEGGVGRYDLPGVSSQILWRFSTMHTEWMADAVAGVDLSTMVFGLAAHPAFLGNDFFLIHNDFQFPDH